jgi:hypothetical protein
MESIIHSKGHMRGLDSPVDYNDVLLQYTPRSNDYRTGHSEDGAPRMQQTTYSSPSSVPRYAVGRERSRTCTEGDVAS